jgi:hypothetical protein
LKNAYKVLVGKFEGKIGLGLALVGCCDYGSESFSSVNYGEYVSSWTASVV